MRVLPGEVFVVDHFAVDGPSIQSWLDEQPLAGFDVCGEHHARVIRIKDIDTAGIDRVNHLPPAAGLDEYGAARNVGGEGVRVAHLLFGRSTPNENHRE